MYWTQPFRTGINFAMAQSGARLLISTFEEGPLMLELDQQRPGARVLWKGHGKSEIDTDKLHASISTPIIDGDYIYGICSYGQLRALDARTGERLWESRAVTVERTRWVSAHAISRNAWPCSCVSAIASTPRCNACCSISICWRSMTGRS